MKELLQIQTAVLNTLNGDSYFALDPDEAKRITVISQNVGDPETEIETAVASLGISVVVIMPLLKNPNGLVPVLGGLRVPLVVQITENVVNNQGPNGTQKPILDVACEVLCLLQGAWTGLGDPRANRIVATESCLTMVSDNPLTYHVNFTAPVTLTPRRAQAAPPAS